jgi:hypothetical protein
VLDASELSSGISQLTIIAQNPATVTEEVRILLVKSGNCASASGTIMTPKLI